MHIAYIKIDGKDVAVKLYRYLKLNQGRTETGLEVQSSMELSTFKF